MSVFQRDNYPRTTQLLVTANGNGIYREMMHVSAAGSGTVGYGGTSIVAATETFSDDADGRYDRLDTSTVSGNAASYAGVSMRWERKPWFQSQLGLYNSLSDVRFVAGLCNSTVTSMVGSDNPAGNYAFFAFSSARSDTEFQCITKDGTTQNVTPSGVEPALDTAYFFSIVTRTGYVIFEIFDPDGTQLSQKILTTNLPSSTTKCQAGSYVETLTTAVRGQYFYETKAGYAG